MLLPLLIATLAAVQSSELEPGEPAALTHVGAPAYDPGTELRVSLVTIDAGRPIVSRFGHSALLVENVVDSAGVLYSYGLSATRQPGWLAQVLDGRIAAGARAADMRRSLAAYVEADRSISLQVLNLTPAERIALDNRLRRESRPGRAKYAYDFFGNNCTTAVRDAIDYALGGRLKAATGYVRSEHTRRSLTRRALARDLILDVALTVVLARPVDQPMSVWEEMFLPHALRERLSEQVVGTAAGVNVPLVVAESTWYRGRDSGPGGEPTTWLHFLAVGTLIGTALVILSAIGSHAQVIARGLACVWLLMVGIFGWAMVAMWCCTAHGLSYGNENLLILSPLALIAGLALLVGLLGLRGALVLARWLVVAVVGSAGLGLLLKLSPSLNQANIEIIALSLPAYFGLCYSLRETAKQ